MTDDSKETEVTKVEENVQDRVDSTKEVSPSKEIISGESKYDQEESVQPVIEDASEKLHSEKPNVEVLQVDEKVDIEVPLPESIEVDLTSAKNNLGHREEDEEIPKPVQKLPTEVKRSGWLRHYIAVLALSGVLLANMNRQAFNQALSKMVCKDKKPFPTTTVLPTTNSTESIVTSTTELPTTIREYIITSTTASPVSLAEFLVATTTQNSSNIEITSYSDFDLKRQDLMPHPTTVMPETGDPQQLQSQPETYYDPKNDCFRWDSNKISILQSAFSYGYIPLMIFSARISEVYGAKWVIFTSSLGSALCCILSPYFANTAHAFYLLVLSRVLIGLSQTGVSPAIYALLVRWLPHEEASVYLPMMRVSVTFGFTFGSLVGGFFSWRMTFYIVAIIGFLWCLVWPFTAESDPKDSRLISRNEFNYIRQEIRKESKNRKNSANTARKKAAPWLAIFTHPVVLTFMLTKLTVKMSTDAQTQQLVMYLKSVFELPDGINGLLNGVNYAIQAIFTGLVAWAAQEFVKRRLFGLSKTGVRKLFQGIANYGMGIAFISITFNMGSVNMICISYFVFSIASMFVAGGDAVFPVDLSTDYAATIMSIANFTANLSGIILPNIVAFILGDERSNPERWNKIWLFMGGVMCAGGTLFCLVAKAEMLDFEQSKLVTLINSLRSKKKESKKTNEYVVRYDKASESVTIELKDITDDKDKNE